jgi:hypothetical protein
MLDIDTARGQVTLQQERRAVAIFHHHFPGHHFYPTPKFRPAVIDGVIVHDDRLYAIAEMKCRTMSLAEFETRFRSEWLVTYEKIEIAHRLADGLCVQFWGMLYLIPDDVLLCKALYRSDIGWLARFSVCKTDTQATVNGGRASRDNAFIDMSEATILHPPMRDDSAFYVGEDDGKTERIDC